MPTFEITAPDGKKYRVDGATAEGALAAIKKMDGQTTKTQDLSERTHGSLGAGIRGAVDTLTGGFADEITSGILAGADAVTGKRPFTEGYKHWQDVDRAITASDSEYHPYARLAGQIAGGVGGGAALAGSGLSLAANAARAGQGLGRVAAGSALEGGAFGLVHGAGSGTDADSRLRGALIGAPIGLAAGGLSPFIVAGAATAAKPIFAPIASRLNPEKYAGNAVNTTLRRSGQSVDNIVDALVDARRDAQPMFTVADAMGHAGQRALSTAARNPHNERQAIVDALMGRQAGQGRRVATALSEAFDAPDTAAQRVGGLTAARNTAADIGYDAARSQTGMVDVSGALRAIDEVLQPGATGVLRPGSTLADDSIESALSRARTWLGNGREQITGFNEALRIKQDIDDMIGAAVRGGANNKARLLGRVRDALDAALEQSSAPYAAARDAFRQGSREIEAVGTGRTAAMRGRPEDTIDTFGGMTPGEQAGFRAGYADPLIEGAQTSAVGVNKARPLLNDATAAEFPAFAAPGRSDQLARRLARENTMFQTQNAALGNSKTADNLADAADMAQFDPQVLTNLLRGRPIQAALDAVTRVVAESSGMSPRVIERVARTLMETRPDVARQLLEQAQRGELANAGQRALAAVILNNLAASGAGRLPGP